MGEERPSRPVHVGLGHYTRLYSSLTGRRPRRLSAHLGEGHDFLCALSGIHLVVKGQESILVLLHQSTGDDVAVASRLDLVNLRRGIGRVAFLDWGR